MNLDELIADAKRRKGLKRSKRSRKSDTGEDAFKRTKEYLRQLKLEACVPVSVHLRVTHQTCECGAVRECVNQVPLVKKVSVSLTHFEAHEIIHDAEYGSLPRFIDVVKVDVPYCEDCFVNAKYTWEDLDVTLKAPTPVPDI